jgi:hypothetical protein
MFTCSLTGYRALERPAPEGASPAGLDPAVGEEADTVQSKTSRPAVTRAALLSTRGVRSSLGSAIVLGGGLNSQAGPA